MGTGERSWRSQSPYWAARVYLPPVVVGLAALALGVGLRLEGAVESSGALTALLVVGYSLRAGLWAVYVAPRALIFNDSMLGVRLRDREVVGVSYDDIGEILWDPGPPWPEWVRFAQSMGHITVQKSDGELVELPAVLTVARADRDLATRFVLDQATSHGLTVRLNPLRSYPEGIKSS